MATEKVLDRGVGFEFLMIFYNVVLNMKFKKGKVMNFVTGYHDVVGTCYQGKIEASYDTLCEVFGEPQVLMMRKFKFSGLSSLVMAHLLQSMIGKMLIEHLKSLNGTSVATAKPQSIM